MITAHASRVNIGDLQSATASFASSRACYRSGNAAPRPYSEGWTEVEFDSAVDLSVQMRATTDPVLYQ